jgi:hypothetical protein
VPDRAAARARLKARATKVNGEMAPARAKAAADMQAATADARAKQAAGDTAGAKAALKAGATGANAEMAPVREAAAKEGAPAREEAASKLKKRLGK